MRSYCPDFGTGWPGLSGGFAIVRSPSAVDRLREVDELAGNIRKVGNSYYGIKLTDTNVTRLPAQRRDRR
jgi:hypothetical protein